MLYANTSADRYGRLDVNDQGQMPLPLLYPSTVSSLCSVIRVALSHAG